MRENRVIWAASAAVLLCAAITISYLDAMGRASRRGDTPFRIQDHNLPVHLVRNSSELYHLYQSKGFRGRIAVHVGAYMHRIDIDTPKTPDANRFPLVSGDMLDTYKQQLSIKNYYWVMMQSNFIREIKYVMPRSTFEEKLKLINPADDDVISVASTMITAHEWGSRIEISSALPDPHRIKEPLIINIDASYFRHGDVADLARRLKTSGLPVDMISLNRADDNPEVSAADKEKLEQFAAIFSGTAK